MRPALGILLLIGLAVVATSPKFLRLRRATLVGALVSGGWLGVAIGLLIGPAGLRLVDVGAAHQSAPLLTIGLGWVGLMIGLQLRVDILRRLPQSFIRIVGVDAGVVFVIFGVAAWMVLSRLTAAPPAVALALAVYVGAASIGWAAETRSIRHGSPPSADLALALRATAGLGTPIAITLFAFTIASIRPTPDGGFTAAPGPALLRFTALIAVALALGIMARFGLRRARDSRPDLLTIFLGVVALITGAAVELRVSPLLAALLAGVVIANLAGPELRKFERFILEAEHVVAVLYAVVAGVLLDVGIGLPGLTLLIALVALRLTLKPLLWTRLLPTESESNARLARLAPIRQSPLALMLGIELVLDDVSPLAPRLLMVIALVGIMCDLVAVMAGRVLPPTAPANPVTSTTGDPDGGTP